METNISNTCFNCDKPYPAVGFFCGGCLTQLKCKSCSFPLEKDNLGCTNCGTPKDVESGNATNLSQNVNTFKLHETATDRIIEATFSDAVGKDFAGILKDTYNAKISNLSNQQYISNSSTEIFDDKTIDAELVEDNLNSSIAREERIIPNNKGSQSVTDYPTLMLISINNLPSNDVEWILVYSLYASNFGEIIYERKDLQEKHVESQRKSPSFLKNLSTNLKSAIRSGYINPLTNGYFLIEKGKLKALEIISRTTGTIPKSKSKKSNETLEVKKSKNRGSKNSLKRVVDLNLYPDKADSLKVFYEKFQCKNDHEKILVFVHYLEEILKVVPITANHIYTCYDDLNLRTPEDLQQTVRSAKSITGWLDGNNSALAVSIKGKNYIKSWNKK